MNTHAWKDFFFRGHDTKMYSKHKKQKKQIVKS
jgi:hypothetical protein